MTPHRQFRVSFFRVNEVGRIPWWAGVAWVDHVRMQAIIFPLGIHRLAAIVRQAWFDFRMETRGPHALEVSFLEGFKAGQQNANAREVDRQIDDRIIAFLRLAKISGLIENTADTKRAVN